MQPLISMGPMVDITSGAGVPQATLLLSFYDESASWFLAIILLGSLPEEKFLSMKAEKHNPLQRTGKNVLFSLCGIGAKRMTWIQKRYLPSTLKMKVTRSIISHG